MSDYLNLTGPRFMAAGLGPLNPGSPVASPPQISKAAPSPSPVPSYGPIAADTQLQGTLSGLLGNDLDRIAAGGVPVSRDVLNLSPSAGPALASAPQPTSDVLSDFRAHGSPISMQALGLSEGRAQLASATPPPASISENPDVLARWETPVDMDPTTLGRIDLSADSVATTSSPLESRVISGDRQAYQQRYQAVGDVLDLGQGRPDVAAALADEPPLAMVPPTPPPVSETKRLDRLVSLMAQGVNVGQVENPLVAPSVSVVSTRDVRAISHASYGTAGSMGLTPTLPAGGTDPSGLLSEHMRGGFV